MLKRGIFGIVPDFFHFKYWIVDRLLPIQQLALQFFLDRQLRFAVIGCHPLIGSFRGGRSRSRSPIALRWYALYGPLIGDIEVVLFMRIVDKIMFVQDVD